MLYFVFIFADMVYLLTFTKILNGNLTEQYTNLFFDDNISTLNVKNYWPVNNMPFVVAPTHSWLCLEFIVECSCAV